MGLEIVSYFKDDFCWCIIVIRVSVRDQYAKWGNKEKRGVVGEDEPSQKIPKKQHGIQS